MALVSDGWFLNVTLVDSGGNSSTLSYNLVAANAADATAGAATVLAELAPITNAVIKSYTLVERFIEDALTLPGAGVNVEERASVVVQLASSPLKRSMVVIPAPAIGIFQGTSGDPLNTIDPTDADLRSYINLFSDSGSGVATISDGELVDNSSANQGIVTGKRTHRRSSRG